MALQSAWQCICHLYVRLLPALRGGGWIEDDPILKNMSSLDSSTYHTGTVCQILLLSAQSQINFFGRESLVRQFSREIIISSLFPFSISKGLMERCSTVLWLQALNNCWYFQNWMLFDLELICCIDFYFSWLLFFQSIQHLVQCESSGYVCQKGQSSQLLVVLLLPWYSATSFPKRSLKPIIRPEKRSFTLKRHNYF